MLVQNRPSSISFYQRLAPENKFPKGLDDAHTALDWVSSNFEPLNLSPSASIYLWGCSGGADLATILAHHEAAGKRRAKGVIALQGCYDITLCGKVDSWKRLENEGLTINLKSANDYAGELVARSRCAISPFESR